MPTNPTLLLLLVQFGAASSVGIDIDPLAITSARQNAALNNMTPDKMQLHLVSGESCPPLMDAKTCGVVEEQKSNGMGVISGREKYDVVIANILLNPLLDLADDIVSHAKHGAIIGLSGILSQQVSSGLDVHCIYTGHAHRLNILEITLIPRK